MALRDAGARVDVVLPTAGAIQGMKHDQPGDSIPVGVVLRDAQASEYDALLLPGDVANPDKLRTSLDAVKFVEAFVAADKPIAAICHGPWTLINAGDAPVVKDRHLVTSRNPTTFRNSMKR